LTGRNLYPQLRLAKRSHWEQDCGAAQRVAHWEDRHPR